MKANNKFKKNQPHTSSAELRYNYLTRKFRQLKDLSKQTQVQVSWLFKEIKDYGFNFFPNHYQWERLNELEGILNKHNNGQI
jgi:hypothetical protein